jgi:hypothetical protein
MTRIVHPHFPVEKLPEELRASFEGQTHVHLTVEDRESDEALLKEFDSLIQQGLDDIAAGNVHSAEEVREYFRIKSSSRRAAAE